ncbi:MAG: hypothetical protein GVY26_09245, partial [Bacteroidetes bacterium]|nr:hypothetical protein [Bacteroidota bacterium]
MDSDKNKLNKLFSEGDPGLPPEFSWEQMEEGIMDKMEELESAAPPPGRGSDRFFKISVILLLCLIPFCFFDHGLETKFAGGASGIQKDNAEEPAQAAADESGIQTLSLPTPPVGNP